MEREKLWNLILEIENQIDDLIDNVGHEPAGARALYEKIDELKEYVENN